MHAPAKIFVLLGSGVPGYDGLIQGLSPRSSDDWGAFLAGYGDIAMTPLDRFQKIADSGYYPVGSIFVFPGGNALRISMALELTDFTEAKEGVPCRLSPVGQGISRALNAPELGYRMIGSCAGAALLSGRLDFTFSGMDPISFLGVLPEVAAIGPMQRGPVLHALRSPEGGAGSMQLGWDNIGFSSVKGDAQVVATYEDSGYPGYAAIVKSEKALATGPHLEVMQERSQLRSHAEQKMSTPFFSSAETEATSKAAAQKIVRDFLRPGDTK